MAWTVTVEEVLKRWVGDDKPAAIDETLLTQIKDSVVLIKLKVKNIEERLNPVPPVEPEEDLQTVLDMVVSSMVQRAYNSDYSTYNSASYTTGPFSESYSKASETKQGIYITPEELALLSLDPSKNNSRISVIHNPARPNFYARGYLDLDEGEFYDCW